MTDKQFDDYFKNQLTGFSSTVPEDLWERMQPIRIEERKRILFWGFYFSMAALFLALGAGGYFVMHSNRSIGDKKKTGIRFAERSQAPAITMGIKKRQNAKSTWVNHNFSAPGQISELKPSQKDGYHPADLIKEGLKKSSSLDQEISENAHIDRKITTSNMPFQAESQNKDIEHPSHPGRPAREGPLKVSNPPLVKQKTQSNLSNISFGCMAVKPWSTQNKNMRVPEVKEMPWFIEVYSSADIPFSKINSNDPYILSNGNVLEKMKLSYSIGLKLGVPICNRFSGEIGVQYAQINSVLEADSGYRNLSHNYYKGIDIPFILAYRLGNNQFNTTIEAGIIVNTYAWYRGMIFENYGLVGISTDVYKVHSGLSAYLGMNINKEVLNNLVVFTEPYFRYRLSVMANANQPFTQKINVAGLALGLRYIFAKSNRDLLRCSPNR
jgi:hypothetical protein